MQSRIDCKLMGHSVHGLKVINSINLNEIPIFNNYLIRKLKVLIERQNALSDSFQKIQT